MLRSQKKSDNHNSSNQKTICKRPRKLSPTSSLPNYDDMMVDTLVMNGDAAADIHQSENLGDAADRDGDENDGTHTTTTLEEDVTAPPQASIEDELAAHLVTDEELAAMGAEVAQNDVPDACDAGDYDADDGVSDDWDDYYETDSTLEEDAAEDVSSVGALVTDDEGEEEAPRKANPPQPDTEAARQKAASVNLVAREASYNRHVYEENYWHPELDGENYPRYLTPVEKAMREMLKKVAANAGDDERLWLCCLVAVMKFDLAAGIGPAAEAVCLYEQYRPFVVPVTPQKLAACLAKAQKHFEATKAAYAVDMLSPSQLIVRLQYDRRSDLIANYLSAAELGTLSGPKNSLKTHVALDACVSLAIGPSAKFLGHFPILRGVATGLLAAEDSGEVILDALERICRAKQVEASNLDGRLFVNVGATWRFDRKSILRLKTFIVANDLALCIVEAGYMSLGGPDQRSLMAMGEALAPIRRLVVETGCAIHLSVHHKSSASKSQFPVLGDIAGVGHEEATRSWAIINKRRYWNPDSGQHWLRLVLGNKFGEQRYHLDVHEGHASDPEGRVWEPTITVPTASAPEKKSPLKNKRRKQPTQQSNELTENEQLMLNVLKQHPEGITKTDLGRTSKVSYRQWDPTIESLMNRKLIAPSTVKKSNGKKVTLYGIRKAEA
jgi:hypothetical protein